MDYPSLLGPYKSHEGYQLVPIRMEDRNAIRKWRNEQMYHLRQSSELSEEQQNAYFNDVVTPLFSSPNPNQYLFSYVKEGNCLGYGGLVHIDYKRKNAELSFIMNTSLEEDGFNFHWTNYLILIEDIAFRRLGLLKIFTYAYDLRPHLYPTLIKSGFIHERTIENALITEEKNIPALIHSKWNAKLRPVQLDDIDQTFSWVNNPTIRKHAFQKDPVLWENHQSWFVQKFNSPECHYYILEGPNGASLGSIRIDQSNDVGTISYLLDPKYHGQGLGIALLTLVVPNLLATGIKTLIGEVLPQNSASVAIFEKLGYDSTFVSDRIRFKKDIYV